MPKKLQKRSTFLPSLSIKTIDMIDPEVREQISAFKKRISLETWAEIQNGEPVPDKLATPMQTFARLDGTPALLKTVEEK